MHCKANLKAHHLPLLLAMLGLLAGCGSSRNLADCAAGQQAICSPKSADEQVQDLMNAGDFSAAITQLEALMASEPTTYQRLTVLAAAYAARSGLRLLNIAKLQVSASGNLLDLFATFLPTPKTVGPVAYKTHLADMKAATEALRRIPAALMAKTDASPYAASAIFQSTLYSAAYAVMFLNQFAISPTTGRLDVDQLASLSEADAEQILDLLLATAAVVPAGNTAAVQSQVTSTVAQIRAEPGETTKEKITGYVGKSQAAGAGPSGS